MAEPWTSDAAVGVFGRRIHDISLVPSSEDKRFVAILKVFSWNTVALDISKRLLRQASPTAFGSNVIASLAAKMGMDPNALAAKLAQALPQAVNKLIPNGVVQPVTRTDGTLSQCSKNVYAKRILGFSSIR